MEKDIKNRISKDFGMDAPAAVVLTGVFEQTFQLPARVTRCVIHLAKGDLTKLKAMIKSAETDWRDVIMWAETTPYEFDTPFE